jgi:hypothetical protein
MAIKIAGTTVINNSRGVENMSNIEGNYTNFHGIVTSIANNLDMSKPIMSRTLTAATTFTASNITTGKVCLLMLDISSSQYIPTWPASIQWPSAGEPTWNASGVTQWLVCLTCWDNTTIRATATGWGTGGFAGTYAVTATSPITEGIAGTMSVTTSGLANGTTLYWTASPAAEFDVSSGSFGINNNGAAFTVTATAKDLEGSESATIQIRTDSISGPIVASDTFTINDDANGTKYALAGRQYYVSVASNVYSFVWYDVTVTGHNGSSSTVSSGGYTYTVGNFMDSITGKGGSTSFYQITRTTT